MSIDFTKLDWQKNSDGLLPAVIQDAETGTVLMLGYMNEEALRVTQETRLVTFYSRSKKRLWKKGETSGNTLKLASADADCDRDALLIRAIPAGQTCHNGTRSCFSATESPLETIGLLLQTIKERSESAAADSYTKQLLNGGIDAYGAKVLEEAEEVVRAARCEGRQRTIEEASDVLFHLLVLLRGEGIELSDIAEELRRRRK
ncbi:MAG: bifunctional phosphoribosyl-AMP cyclohydrolase/phosphoribosyl-ATP diphosphatase HisIE [Candidatus Peribacteraceae bacterium]|nr:bifunctional phosphoribosyl-AMP cyclohydrolase/phosphoribosyl-ATP diphosphatase HisIE [Candidatus Peribacteraceae bacterium]